MTDENLATRHPLPGDAQVVQELITACEIAEFGEPDTNLEDLLDQWSGIDLSQDAWLVVASDDQPVGYAAVLKGLDRLTYDYYTHPTLAPAGLDKLLLDKCEARAHALIEAGEPVNITVFISNSDQAAKQTLAQLGFSPIKYHLRMQIELDGPPPEPAWPERITLRNFVPGQDDRLVHAFIQAAFDRPGRVPQPFESWRDFMMGAYNFESEIWFLAFSGDELVGTALCFDYPQFGWVRQLGVASHWRRRGLGSALLLHAFGIFYRRGHQSIALGVESNNPNAYQLYEGVGMKRTREFAEYRKTLDG